MFLELFCPIRFVTISGDDFDCKLGIGLHVLLVPAGLYSERHVGPAKSIALLSILVATGWAYN